MLPFVTQYQPLLVYYKRSFHGRVEPLTKPTTTFPFFKEPPNLSIISYKKRKLWQRTCSLEQKY